MLIQGGLKSGETIIVDVDSASVTKTGEQTDRQTGETHALALPLQL